MYDKGKLNDEQMGAVHEVRDTYATAEMLIALTVEVVGRLPHMRDAAARLVNYSYPELSSASIAEGDKKLADTLGCLQSSLAHLKEAHLEDLLVAEDMKEPVGMPSLDVMWSWLDRMTERLTDSDGNRMTGLGR